MNTGLGRVLLLMGGMSAEREVSLMSGRGVLRALESKGAEVTVFDPACTSVAEIASGGAFDRAFIALHGRFGEDGCVQGLLELLQIPYTGSGVRASACAMDKALTRMIWEQAGLPVAAGMLVESSGQAEEVFEKLGGSVVVKPSREGSSIGITKLGNAGVEEIRSAIDAALVHDPEVLVEERVYGRELTVAILGGRAMPIIEIKAPQGDYDYRNKYFGDAVSYVCPAEIPQVLAQGIAQASEGAFAALGARGWGRVDIMLRQDGSFVLLELNTSPGMTQHSLVPMAARAAGISYEDLVEMVALDAGLDNAVSGKGRS